MPCHLIFGRRIQITQFIIPFCPLPSIYILGKGKKGTIYIKLLFVFIKFVIYGGLTAIEGGGRRGGGRWEKGA